MGIFSILGFIYLLLLLSFVILLIRPCLPIVDLVICEKESCQNFLKWVFLILFTKINFHHGYLYFYEFSSSNVLKKFIRMNGSIYQQRKYAI
ncbi:unnamed protein product [Moneuplotes crassus]|uniref:Uncharacterized protein n=1 Tax=Euplotes crassus TaxID=5936 RepID=A0AAD1U5Z0_EUPCR|nr:unnamed protein product [Moneuplotes crassus]